MGIDAVIPALLGLPGKLKTVLDRLTSTRAGYLDNLATSLTNTTWTDAKAGFLDAAITTRMSSIKSIRRGSVSVSFTSGGGSATVTLSPSVDVDKTLVFYMGMSGNALGGYATLSNSTTITCGCGGYGTNMGLSASSATVYWQLIEFN